jgi:hypothetical protein
MNGILDKVATEQTTNATDLQSDAAITNTESASTAGGSIKNKKD